VDKADKKLLNVRDDLKLIEGSPQEDGSPSWLIYDVLRSKYFRITSEGLNILNFWEQNSTVESIQQKVSEANLNITDEDINDFVLFMVNSNLCVSAAAYKPANKARSGSPVVKLIKNYLFFRIPLTQPDNFLKKTLPYIQFLFSPITSAILILLGLAGILMVLQQWDKFVHTFNYFFSLKGMAIYGGVLVGVKLIHELGHAYQAKKLGCKVPTMGVAFMVLIPLLYTDTTDAWKIKNRRDRFKIAVAGVKTELYLALISTFMWSVVPDGALKTAFFLVATSTWITSLLINMSPFMRFDGYYAMADMLGMDNMQTRAFAFGKWRLRKILFGIDSPMPENLQPSRVRLLVLYSWGTWIYRFFLFMGIAFMVYFIAIKVLGIILFVVEILFFIVLPITKEFAQWWKNRERANRMRSAVTFSLFIIILLLIFIPYKKTISLPAVLEAKDRVKIFFPADGRIEKISYSNGSKVKKDDVLISLKSDDVDHQLKLANIKLKQLENSIKSAVASKEHLESYIVLAQSLVAEKTSLDGLLKVKRKLNIRANIKGLVFPYTKFNEGEVVGKDSLCCELVDNTSLRATAYVDEKELNKIVVGSNGHFIPDNNVVIEKVAVKVNSVSDASVKNIDFPSLTHIHGGDIVVSMENKPNLNPLEGTYIIDLEVLENIRPARQMRGKVVLVLRKESLAYSIFKSVYSTLIKESSF